MNPLIDVTKKTCEHRKLTHSNKKLEIVIKCLERSIFNSIVTAVALFVTFMRPIMNIYTVQH